MRCIDADALIAQMEAEAEHIEEPIGAMFAYAAINDVKHAPTIEERKTGRWDDEGNCSVCGHCDWDCTESKWFKFCPNCGADMREGAQDG